MTDEFEVIKVAHVVGSLKIGGAERFVIDLCEVQKNNGEQPFVISLGQPGEALEQECHQLSTAFYSYNNSLIVKLVKVFYQLLKCNVIHIHTPHALNFLSPILPLLKAKIIYTRHGAAPLASPHWIKLHQKVMPYIDSITFVSQEGKDIFQRTHHWHNVPSYVIDNGVLIQPIEKSASESVGLRIGSVGRMIPLKNQIALLRSASLLPLSVQENLEIHYFGDGECMAALQEYNSQQDWPVKVFFHGMVNDRNVIYSSFDVLAVTSETEGLSMVIIEAMANYIPVVATDVGGNPKLVIDNKTGYLFDYNDDVKLAQLLEAFSAHKQSINDLGEQAFAYIKEQFSLEATAKKYAELYQA
ncbi:glycosyltransferase family 4 protein [Thalassotalea piscium]